MKKCKSFSLDLMHLSTNELNEIKDLEALKKHLKECTACQKKLKKLIDVDVFTFLARPRSEKYKRGMAELSERIRKETSQNKTGKDETSDKACQNAIIPKGKIISVEELFSGETSTVWETINKHGIVSFEDLPVKSNLPPGIAYGAMVLLAQKNELCIVEHKNHVDLFLPK
jgi:hypothetical protein